jgi:5-methylcytosine-specific restriction endonuclease McrA
MSFERVPRRLRQRVAKRARWRCEYCLTPAAFATQPFEVDHVVPRSRGGLTTWDNLAFSCGCNGHKGQRTHASDPRTDRVVALYNPRRQRWSRHFAWSEDFLLIRGRTATGRATVKALCLNRAELANLRGLLVLASEHPPNSDESPW